MTDTAPPRPKSRAIYFLAAFGAGGLLTLTVDFNGLAGLHGGPVFSSWTAHGAGTIAAILFLIVLSPLRRGAKTPLAPRVPLWAYLGGLSGALTVILTALTVNSPVGLPGTLALGIAGQVVFGLAADRWGLFGLPRRIPTLRDLGALVLVLAGSGLIIFTGSAG